jgi:hypothetical protein
MLLQKKNKGLAIVLLQLQLRRLGYYAESITGQFTEAVQVAVQSFQNHSGLVVDGLAGNKTRSKLEEATKDALLCMFVHCSATREGQDLRGDWIKNLHMKKKGWSRPGYSDAIWLNGTLENLRHWDTDNNISGWEYTFGVKGSTLLNRNSRHVCYIGPRAVCNTGNLY